MPNAIMDPTAQPRPGAQEDGLALAPRAGSLDGAKVGLLENGKQNARLFLEELSQVLEERYGAQPVMIRRKTVITEPAPPEIAAELRDGCDVVITGVGDCGSCSASAVHDGVLFERAGTPAAVICSDAFRATADAMADVQGAAGYRYLTTPHPVAGLTPDQVRERAQTLAGQVAELLAAR
jgi:hypothetical protein